MLEALFNFPRWMHLFGFPCIGVGGYPYLPGSNTTWGEVKATLCSGFNEKGLWATSMCISELRESFGYATKSERISINFKIGKYLRRRQ